MAELDDERIRKSLKFRNAAQHSVEQLERIDAAVKRGEMAAKDAVAFVEMLVSHVHPATPGCLEQLAPKFESERAFQQAGLMRMAYDRLRPGFRLENLDANTRSALYALDGTVLIEKQGSKKLLVLLTTMFNNFFFSNGSIAAQLGSLDCNLLILKDSSMAMHLAGLPGFAETRDELAPAIRKLAEKHGFEEIFVTGYSSAGLAALWLSLELDCQGYIGFSHFIEGMAPGKTQDSQAMRDYLSTFLHPSKRPDMKPLLREADPSVPRLLFYGELSPDDASQAEYVQDLDTIRTIGMKDTGHNTILPLVAQGKFAGTFAKVMGLEKKPEPSITQQSSGSLLT